MQSPKEAENLIGVLVERFEHQQLPRILELRKLVTDGGVLTDYERDYLEAICREAMESKHLVDMFPQYQPLFAQVVHLYREITDLALKNEASGAGIPHA